MAVRYCEVLMLLVPLLAVVSLAADLTPSEARGRTLYRKGTGASGEPVIASLAGQTEVKGNVVPCSGCHGLDGRGKAEGGVVPSSVRWEDLARPYEVTAPSGRKHPQYTERSLVRAIAMGMDPAGNKLHNVMPRYALTRGDADDLIAYLKKISTDYDPGLSDGAIRIGALLPPEARFDGLGRTVKAALTAYFDSVNRTGGLYGRRIEGVFQELPESPADQAGAYSRFIESGDVFALVSSFLAGAETPVVEVIEKWKVALVGGWTLLPQTKPSVFYLDGGLPAQAEALAKFVATRFGGAKPVLISSSEPLSQAAVRSVRAVLTDAQELRMEDADALVTRLKSEGSEVLFALLPGVELRSLMAALKRNGWNPAILVPGAFAAGPLLRELGSLPGPVHLASPFLPTDVSADAQAEYRRLAADSKLPAEGVASQFTAICEARILVEGLKRAGRDLSRERLLESLESLYDFPAGYKQVVSFGPNRRIGIPGVHIVTVDKSGGLREVQ